MHFGSGSSFLDGVDWAPGLLAPAFAYTFFISLASLAKPGD